MKLHPVAVVGVCELSSGYICCMFDRRFVQLEMEARTHIHTPLPSIHRVIIILQNDHDGVICSSEEGACYAKIYSTLEQMWW